jgi:hypothetical protein
MLQKTRSSNLSHVQLTLKYMDRDMPLVGELVDLIPRGEDEAHGVSIILTNENLLFQSSTSGSDTLKKLGVEVGLARLGSKIDLLLQRGCSKPLWSR